MLIKTFCGALCAFVTAASGMAAELPTELRVGRAGHAFDHLGGIGDQAKTAAASGATIIYASGLGGYLGLPPAEEFAARVQHAAEYSRRARASGIELVIGYACATSIVKLAEFDKHWSKELRKSLTTPPADWLQRDRQGRPLASWYGGDYSPACMNHPDWRRYQEYIVRQQLETGQDGVFFDNPTVHPNGCYCAHCMASFARFLAPEQGTAAAPPAPSSGDDLEAIRKLTDAHLKKFLQFRATIARDFIAHMRRYARTIKPDALVTCNNSLNSPSALYSQCRSYAYNIHELSKAEDYVVAEDMASQPRIEADGRVIEYGPTYRQLHAISHGKPIVAVTIADGDYHTPANLMRLAMAEAAAHDASYLSWPTWPEEQRARMASAVRSQAAFLREHEAMLNNAKGRADVVLFLPFQRWLETDDCAASRFAAELTRANVQYEVVSEDNFDLSPFAEPRPVLVIESQSILTAGELATVNEFKHDGGVVVTADAPDWFSQVQRALKRPSVELDGPSTLRAVVRDQPSRTLVHIYNLNVRRLSSFEDKVTAAEKVKLSVSIPFQSVQSVTVMTADADGSSGPVHFSTHSDGGSDMTRVEFEISKLQINSLVVIEVAK